MSASSFRELVVGVVCAVSIIIVPPKASGQVLNESGKLLASDGAVGDELGWAVSVSGNVAFVGARLDDDNGPDSGAVYVFRRIGLTWVQEQKLLASDGAAGDQFGNSVSVSGDVAIVGATLDDDNGPDSGSAYVFRWNGSSWAQQQKLLASDGAADDRFAAHNSVSVSGNVAVVGEVYDDDNGTDSGSAYIFRYDSSQTVCGQLWCEEQKLLASNGGVSAGFGGSIASHFGDVVIVGAVYGGVGTSGSAYIFRYDASQTVCGQSWCEEQKLVALDGSVNDLFGYSVSVSDDVAVVGSPLHNDNGPGSGSAYVFRWNGSSWVQEQKLVAADEAADDRVGISVSVSGDVVVVAAYLDDDNGTNSGSAYVFRLNGSSWVQEQKLLPSDGAAGDQFGHAVSVSGHTAFVGANWHDDNGTDSGSAYVFNVLGTCCISNGSCEVEGNCQENITPSVCASLGGSFLGPNLTCTEACIDGACIPAVSTWGLIVLVLLVASEASIMIARKVELRCETTA